MHDCDVLIVGGGLNGPVLALALAQAGLGSIVLDGRSVASRAEPDFDGRAYALSLSSQRLLAALGLWRELSGHAQPIEAIRISDGRPGEGASRLFLHFDGSEIDEGPMGQIIEDRYLRAALLAAMEAAPSIEHRAGATVVGQAVAPGSVTVTLADGGTADRGAAGRLRRSRQPGCGARRNSAARLGLRADVAGRGRDARAAAPRRGAPVLHAGRPAGDPAVARRSLVDRLDRANRPRPRDRRARRRRISRRAAAAVRRLPGRDRSGRRPVRLSARAVAGRALDRPAAGAGRRRGARHSSAGRSGAEPRVARRGGARGGRGRRPPPRRGHRRGRRAGPLCALAPIRHRRCWRRRPTG